MKTCVFLFSWSLLIAVGCGGARSSEEELVGSPSDLSLEPKLELRSGYGHLAESFSPLDENRVLLLASVSEQKDRSPQKVLSILDLEKGTSTLLPALSGDFPVLRNLGAVRDGVVWATAEPPPTKEKEFEARLGFARIAVSSLQVLPTPPIAASVFPPMSKYSKEGKATRPYDAGVPPVLTSSIGYSHASILPISGGRTAALVTLIDRLDLFFLNEFGVVTETRSVIPPNDGSVIKVLGFQQGFLRETTDGSFNAVVGLDQDEKATFEAFHELRIEGWSAAHQPVCLKLDRFGKVLSARAIPSSQGRHLFIDAADAVDDKSFAVVGSDLASADSRTFVGRCQFGSEQIRSEAWSIKIGKKADNADAILSLEDGSFLVGGTFGYQQVETGSVVEAGDAYVLHFHPDRPRQKPIRLGRPRADRASDLFRLGKQVYVAVSHDGPITHDEDRSGHTVIYRVALPPTASK